jgi:hypothetical protein
VIAPQENNWRGLAGEWQDVARSKTSRISELTAQLSSLQSQEARWFVERESLRELLSDAIHCVSSGYSKRRINLNRIQIDEEFGPIAGEKL